ncbi:hypothetical protein JW930_05825 [Candidatus Woesearchaeota archaeon]|nr:hypothetical protein [Candidatus Woesearchaeota archaeon]
MFLVRKAFEELYPNKETSHRFNLRYSRAFKGYNANVKYDKQNMEFRLSYEWKSVSDEIKIGLIQSLFNKVFKTNISTLNIDLYNTFLKKIPLLTPKIESDPVLEDSFYRVNEKYFYGMILKPNLVWGGDNFRTLGTYDYTTDTIRVSKILDNEPELLDYIMYHEMLHKKLKYRESKKRNIHHTKEFRKKEKEFDIPDIEKRLNRFLRKQRFKNHFSF